MTKFKVLAWGILSKYNNTILISNMFAYLGNVERHLKDSLTYLEIKCYLERPLSPGIITTRERALHKQYKYRFTNNRLYTYCLIIMTLTSHLS